MDKDTKQRFSEIKAMYENILPEWMETYRRTGNMYFDRHMRDWILEFTPIEYLVWQDLTANNIPFYPQFPACGFFLDFANPFKKIAIECDGKDFHSADKDAKRDQILTDNGWRVIRISGAECYRQCVNSIEDMENRQEICDYFIETSEGIIFAIKKFFFDGNLNSYEHADLVEYTINLHMPTKPNGLDIGAYDDI